MGETRGLRYDNTKWNNSNWNWIKSETKKKNVKGIHEISAKQLMLSASSGLN